eukprot:CAMPEP_0167750894 /NCGR_PEP_ID=MMETSP0110_2-20121227/6245_1 /TAXON_ID=629695 /ORGANISM="Gymnochlora sp., Strain CCMP2014" /LENGTH=578 /DNA_ID=CAMNT_0007636267 /DNA_START=1235 /DNA_END=2971 /DNA_ORIENTATION=-
MAMVALGLVIWSLVAASGFSMPKGFDWRSENGIDYVHPMQTYLNPKGCSPSWAFAAASMLSDRLTVANGGREKVFISPQVMMNCAVPWFQSGCHGGSSEKLIWAFEYMNKTGVVDSTCLGYRGSPSWFCEVCMDCYPFCLPVKNHKLYPIKDYYTLDVRNSMTLKADIMKHGPIACELTPEALDSIGSFAPKLKGNFAGTLIGWTSTSWILNPLWGSIDLSVGKNTKTNRGYYEIPLDSPLVSCWGVIPEIPRFVSRKLSLSSFASSLASTGVSELAVTGYHTLESVVVSAANKASKPSRKNSEEKKEDKEETYFVKELPQNLDWRFHNGSIAITPVRNHHIGPFYCGACYAMASTSTFSDRLKIMRGGGEAPDMLTSAQEVIDCVWTEHSHGCFGGNAYDVFKYIQEKGIVDETCKPYTSYMEGCNRNGECQVCDDHSCKPAKKGTYSRYFAKDHGKVQGEKAMMQQLYNGGPLECMMATPKIFEEYTTGILCDKTNATNISHDVEIVGYGEENGQKYWIGKNSWGTKWGEDGYFKICRGINNMAIESACAWVTPDVADSQLKKVRDEILRLKLRER